MPDRRSNLPFSNSDEHLAGHTAQRMALRTIRVNLEPNRPFQGQTID